MTLNDLQDRKVQLEGSIAQATNQVFVLHGHKQEVEYQIQLEMEKTAEKEADKLANSERPPIQ
jgi:hypothetical protein